MVRGGRGKKGCLSQRHAHITNTKTITGTAPGVPGRSCALPASRGASHSKYCTALPVLFSFLPCYPNRFLAFRTPSFRHPPCPLHPPTSRSTHQGRPPASEGSYGSGRESSPVPARSRTDARSLASSTKFECTFALSMMQPWEKAVICKPLTIAAHNCSTHNPSTPQGLP